MGDIWEDTCEQRCYLYRFDLVLEEVVVGCEIYVGLKRVFSPVNQSWTFITLPNMSLWRLLTYSNCRHVLWALNRQRRVDLAM